MKGSSHPDSRAAAAPSVVFAPLWGLLLALLATGCGSAVGSAGEVTDAATAEVDVVTTEHVTGDCSGSFIAHDLPHLTSGPGATLDTFDATGSGIAAGDLDGDGDGDLVLPNLSGATTVLENTGRPDTWVRHELIEGRFRGAAIIDHDGDDDLDIVLTTGIGPPVLFDNAGPTSAEPLSDRFERQQFDGVRAATYTMAWSDLGGDGDLDLVTGSYNAELSIIRNTPVLGSDTGVILYESEEQGFEATRLSPDAQALAAAIADVDGDNRLDVVVGNDLATADFVWVDSDDGWVRSTPFATTTYSTMSYDAADLDGDGRPEFFATDMAPLPDESDDDWREVIADMEAAPQPDEVQIPENVLNRFDGEWDNQARSTGIDATGWSWSGLFGDLDNDGLEDIHVVNGMQSDNLFSHLPNSRLVEPNQAFRNEGATFAPIPEWGLGDTAGGRGSVMFDADGDGDLDIAVNNLDAPARLFENQLCGGGSITVELRWPGTGNTRALGATVAAVNQDSRRTRFVTSSRGYLSAAPPVAHLGLGSDGPVDLEIRWPDGRTSTIPSVSSGSHLMVTRRTTQE